MPAAPDDTSARFDVAVIGGGASGALVAIHLLRGRDDLRVCIVEPRHRLGEGIAYSTSDPAHLLNVRAAGMSAFDDDAHDFVRHLAAADPDIAAVADVLAEAFVPRQAFGRYLRDTLAAYAETALHLREEAVDLQREGDAGFRIRLGSGRTLAAAAVVLATGNAPRAPLAGMAPIIHGWDAAALGEIPADATVGIVGAGLSMVDVVLGQLGRGHHGPLRVLSRHGLAPLPHATRHAPAGDVDALLPLGLRQRLRALRSAAAAGADAGEPWQWTMERLRPHGRALWQSLDAADQRRFLRHAVRHWDIHRHRIAPQVHARLRALLDSGRLQLQAGRVRSIDADGSSAVLRFQPRGGTGEVAMRVDRLVDCTGIETRLSHRRDTLVRALLDAGTITPGPHGLGLAVDGRGAAVDAAGNADPQLLAIGALRLGVEWETTAVPDLRRQAAAIAAHLRQSMAGNSG